MGVTDWILEVRGAGLAYHGTPVLKGIDLDVRRGEMLGLIGPNGAGKSSLIRVASGIAKPTTGTIRFEGRRLESYRDRERGQRIAVMRQHPHLGFAYPVYDVVAMGRYPHKRRLAPLDDDDRLAVEQAMETAGVGSLGHRLINTLSGGERQRVFLARALAQQPTLLFLDEPTANLDIRYQLEILTLIRRLNREKRPYGRDSDPRPDPGLAFLRPVGGTLSRGASRGRPRRKRPHRGADQRRLRCARPGWTGSGHWQATHRLRRRRLTPRLVGGEAGYRRPFSNCCSTRSGDSRGGMYDDSADDCSAKQRVGDRLNRKIAAYTIGTGLCCLFRPTLLGITWTNSASIHLSAFGSVLRHGDDHRRVQEARCAFRWN